jgi:cytochrome c oxidase subunit 2
MPASRNVPLILAAALAGCAAADPVPPEPTAPPSPAPPPTLTVKVTARQDAWSFEYPDGVVRDELCVPVRGEFTLVLASSDFAHALRVPRLGLHAEAVPGRETRCVVRASSVGSFTAPCAGACPPGRCRVRIVVLEPGAFRRWLSR